MNTIIITKCKYLTKNGLCNKKSYNSCYCKLHNTFKNCVLIKKQYAEEHNIFTKKQLLMRIILMKHYMLR